MEDYRITVPVTEEPRGGAVAVKSPSRSDVSFLALAFCALIISVLTSSTFPIVDSSLFEYYGHSVSTGARLYIDLWDNKLPSIYYVNALWWIVFGANFRLHAFAEAGIDLCTFALFSAILRTLGVRRWAAATFGFSLLYLFAGGSLNQTERYATPLLFGGILLCLVRQSLLGGVAFTAASTFWIPSILVGILPLAAVLRRREVAKLILATLIAGFVYVATFLAMFGRSTAVELVRSWFSYVAGSYVAPHVATQHTYLLPFFAPRYYIPSGLGLMLCLIATFWSSDVKRNRASRFALWWAGITLFVVFAIGRPFNHYFVPLFGPLVILLSLQEIRLSAVKRRWFFASAAAICAVLMLGFAVYDHRKDALNPTPSAIELTGDLIRRTFGVGAVAALPWEVYLTSEALPPSRFFLVRNLKFAMDRDRWVRKPLIFVDSDPPRFTGITPPHDLHFVCQSPLIYPYVIHAARPIVGISCEGPHASTEPMVRRRPRRG